MPKYSVRIKPHCASALTKGIIEPLYFPTGAIHEFIVNCDDHAAALEWLTTFFEPTDKRPLAGKSYLSACVQHAPRVGDRVALKTPYPIGYDAGGKWQVAKHATVSEIVNEGEGYISVWPDGYFNQFVDFTRKEYVVIERRNEKQRKEYAASLVKELAVAQNNREAKG